MNNYGADKLTKIRLVEVLNQYDKDVIELGYMPAYPRPPEMDDMEYLAFCEREFGDQKVKSDRLRAKAEAVCLEVMKRKGWVGKPVTSKTSTLKVELACSNCGATLNLVKVCKIVDEKLSLQCQCEKERLKRNGKLLS